MGFKRHISGVNAENSVGHMEIGYRWMHSWMYNLETINELFDSVNKFHIWVQKERTNKGLSERLYESLHQFALKNIQQAHANWATHIRMGKVTLGTSTSLSEAMHSALKSGYLSTNPMQNLGELAMRQVAKSDCQLTNRKLANAASLQKTALYHDMGGTCDLTPYAANIYGTRYIFGNNKFPSFNVSN
jgi:hypothetical protein